jgi:midasin
VLLKCGAKLVVLNMSQQTDSGDLLGGFKPIDPADALRPLVGEYVKVVEDMWSW